MIRALVTLSVSVLSALCLLVMERAAGIGWDFHPDAALYVEQYADVTAAGLSGVPNNLYFYVSDAVHGSLYWLLAINIAAYAFTNLLLVAELSRRQSSQGFGRGAFVVALVLVMFAPYRMHLAVHALKDTLIIGLLCLLVCCGSRWVVGLPSLVAMLLLRIFSGIYLLVFARGRYLLILVCFAAAALAVSNVDLMTLIVARNSEYMGGREFDSVPAFSEYGLTGAIGRAVSWPALGLTGFFAAVSPAPLFLPIAAEIGGWRVWSRLSVGHWGLTYGAFACAAILAASVTTYTAYLRYLYPVSVVLPFLRRERMHKMIERPKLLNHLDAGPGHTG